MAGFTPKLTQEVAAAWGRECQSLGAAFATAIPRDDDDEIVGAIYAVSESEVAGFVEQLTEHSIDHVTFEPSGGMHVFELGGPGVGAAVKILNDYQSAWEDAQP